MRAFISVALVLSLYVAVCSAYGPHSAPYTYVGCFRDAAHRDLSRHVATYHMSPERCYRECNRFGYLYFGLQYTYYCFCGNVFGMYGKADDRECNMRCDGNIAEWCGGGWRNSVYRIDANFPSRG